MRSLYRFIHSVFHNRVPGQLVIQYTDQCNATCPQCGMRVTERFPRSTIEMDEIKRIIDGAAARGVSALSFTGGEPLLFPDRLAEMIRYAGSAGIEMIRTGTNGHLFKNPERDGFTSRVTKLAEKLADTPLRNFWISIDSSIPAVHEQMRGFANGMEGIRKAVGIFHQNGIYPSANLGVNRNINGEATSALHPGQFSGMDDYLNEFYAAFRFGFKKFYRFVIDLGFTTVNTCYPMSVDNADGDRELNSVYAATSIGDVVRFSAPEKEMLFQALLDTIPEFRPDIRIFSPLCSLHALARAYREGVEDSSYPCKGGLDFFFIAAGDGNTYPCGYRGNENLGKFYDSEFKPAASDFHCRQCDWECFRDPSELFGPILQAGRDPLGLMRKAKREPEFFHLWMADLKYYFACDFFNGRLPMKPARLSRFRRRQTNWEHLPPYPYPSSGVSSAVQ